MASRESYGIVVMTLAFLLLMGAVGGYVLLQGLAEAGAGPGGPAGTGLGGGGGTYQEAMRSGTARMSREDLVGSVDAFSAAIGLDPNSPEPYRARGAANLQLGDAYAAIQDYTNAIELDGATTEDFLRRAEASALAGDVEAAIADYDAYLERNPDDLSELRARGRLLRESESYARAAADMIRVRELEAARGRASLQFDRDIAWTQWGAADYDGVLESYDRVVEGQAGRLHGHFGRGATYLYMGRNEEAKAELEHAVSLAQDGRDYAFFYLWLAMAQLGERDEADRRLGDFIEQTNPDRLGPWSLRIAAFLRRAISEETFLAEAEAGQWNGEAEQMCEAYYYAGFIRRLDEDLETAARYFQEVLDTKMTNYYEYFGAIAGLEELKSVAPERP